MSNASGLSLSVLPNGCLFAIEHRRAGGAHHDQPGPRLAARRRHRPPLSADRRASRASSRRSARLRDVEFGAAADRFVWAGETEGIRHEIDAVAASAREPLALAGRASPTRRRGPSPCDAILVQDVGLAARGFLMNSEAYASQYIDHHVAAASPLAARW